MKKPNSIEKKITARISKETKASKMFVGTILRIISHKSPEDAARSGTSLFKPKSAPTPGFIRFTKTNPVTIANKLVLM